ncbi:MAG TPA: hypothetical protein VHE34_02570 [Puia sp.]|uniref:hypothetical protein n=1 Tax=Puia sp. TaxID=2045100 RepID=UPI002BEA7144|nr:hypothetical protein [Puia sp.]HVU94072.1 hypothetical protein [Puia sp.]
MSTMPVYVPLLFGASVLAAVFTLWRAANRSRVLLIFAAAWIALESVIPPVLPLLAIPPMLIIIAFLATKKGRGFIHTLDLPTLTLLHTLRIVVEFVLYQLYRYHAIPILMTFEGRNLDILSGLSAPLVYYFAFVRHRMPTRWLITWNLACIVLLFNAVAYGVLTAPGPLQHLSFDHPNIALRHFPYVLLPGVLVPIVLFSNAASIVKLLKIREINGDKFFVEKLG